MFLPRLRTRVDLASRALGDQMRDLQRKLEQAKQENRDLEREKRLLKRRTDLLEDQVEDASRAKREQQKELKKVERDLQKLRNRLKGEALLQSQISQLDGQLSSERSRSKRADLQRRLAESKVETERRQTEERMAGLRTRKNAEIHDLEREIATLEHKDKLSRKQQSKLKEKTRMLSGKLREREALLEVETEARQKAEQSLRDLRLQYDLDVGKVRIVSFSVGGGGREEEKEKEVEMLIRVCDQYV
jgi:chromosome segregation ATPase